MSKCVCEEKDFLCNLVLSSKHNFIKLINQATPNQIRAIVKCIENFSKFQNSSTRGPNHRQISQLKSQLHNQPTHLKSILTKRHNLVRAILAQIFQQICFGEICHYLWEDGASDESSRATTL